MDHLIHKQLIEERLNQLVPAKELPYFSLFEGARYSLLNGGKRIRPLLTLATTELLGGDLQKALDPACAIELIHTYSLIHDDLPCMDDDDFRRGQPTLHKLKGEGQAVLAGDYLLTHAFEVIVKSRCSPEEKIELISHLTQAAGGDGMVGGQMMDLMMTNKSMTLNELQFLHHHKTGALLQASVHFGIILGQTGPIEKWQLLRFGEKLGLLFQIIDDIIDVEMSEEKHGQTISTDKRNQKTTYVTLLGPKKAKEEAISLFEESQRLLETLDRETSTLSSLLNQVISPLERYSIIQEEKFR
ncbi:MAG: polyprenyl synthetase family protein [Chlamydiia bacterium]|nr:polyprenyl synthetase family protein [Chlamydiia bacterium]